MYIYIYILFRLLQMTRHSKKLTIKKQGKLKNLLAQRKEKQSKMWCYQKQKRWNRYHTLLEKEKVEGKRTSCVRMCMYALEIRLMNDSNGQWWAHSERRTWGKRIDFGGSGTPLIPIRSFVILFLHELLPPSLHQYLLEVCELSTSNTLPLGQKAVNYPH